MSTTTASVVTDTAVSALPSLTTIVSALLPSGNNATTSLASGGNSTAAAAVTSTPTSTPTPTATNAPQGGGQPAPRPAGMAVGLGISLGFAIVLICMTAWHLRTKARLRRQHQQLMMAHFDFASDQPMKPGGGTRTETVELLGLKGEAMGGKETPETAVFPISPSTSPSPPRATSPTGPRRSWSRGRPLHQRAYAGPSTHGAPDGGSGAAASSGQG